MFTMAWCRTGNKPFPELMLTQFTGAYMRHKVGGDECKYLYAHQKDTLIVFILNVMAISPWSVRKILETKVVCWFTSLDICSYIIITDKK